MIVGYATMVSFNPTSGMCRAEFVSLMWSKPSGSSRATSAERLVNKMLPLNDQHREDIARVRDQIWSLYAMILKAYKLHPTTNKNASWESERLKVTGCA